MPSCTASRIVLSASVISDGLWCFGTISTGRVAHEEHVTSGGECAVPQFQVVDTLLGNLKIAMSGSYLALACLLLEWSNDQTEMPATGLAALWGRAA
ncbi:hypothetical protein FUT69_10485 [Xylella taiwanensis]|uniref:Uncharacterized protein n=1 Tax=Xylella taiwanensis TaxID=1444770 RepID=Z9JNT4_9GAMM|nr:hypothetical protein [Xylella taiwanensis]AXI82488.1 hypothetical protein AB672_00080 [Xylella taiwanensis]EWS79422.1 hypothetical protein AF72_00060 [Xylella taiwanensis]MCD8457886.1 hypothetical protein [Xylella taiwanensis]MCD8460021.1 hypothetical protein [Xylella taiwanensis]MCD8463918.1 hypothetical protein [Xylella taiwanensis]